MEIKSKLKLDINTSFRKASIKTKLIKGIQKSIKDPINIFASKDAQIKTSIWEFFKKKQKDVENKK
jgi:hypothetical protein